MKCISVNSVTGLLHFPRIVWDNLTDRVRARGSHLVIVNKFSEGCYFNDRDPQDVIDKLEVILNAREELDQLLYEWGEMDEEYGLHTIEDIEALPEETRQRYLFLESILEFGV